MASYTHIVKGPLTCGHCGHTGEDVHLRYSYIGGQGEVRGAECDDRTACWRRADEQAEQQAQAVAA